MEYGNKSKRSPDPSLMLPQPTFNDLSKEGRSMWIRLPDNDRAVIVSAIGSAVVTKPDTSKHPSPGNREHFSANQQIRTLMQYWEIAMRRKIMKLLLLA